MDDWQEQIQELHALSAIYPDELHIPGVTASESSDELADRISKLAESEPPTQGVEARLLVHLVPISSPLTVKVSSASSAALLVPLCFITRLQVQ